jgi:hypothetical protein
VAHAGGAGGQGFILLQFNGTTSVALISGTSYAIPAGTATMKAWVIGAGGGGAGVGASDSEAGGSGGAGGIAYYAWT